MTTQAPSPSVITSPAEEDLTLFSANDRRIDPSDPIFKSVPPVGVVSQLKPLPDSQPTDLNVLSALRANTGAVGGGFPVSMVPSDGGDMLYSFTLPSSKPHPHKPPSVTESFGVLSTQVCVCVCVCVCACVLCVCVHMCISPCECIQQCS